MRALIIGDVHGCRRELERLLEVAGRRADDTIVLVGDLVAKGPDSRGVVRLARELGALGVRGNHDERVLSWKRAVDTDKSAPELRRHHAQVCETLGRIEWAYLEALPYFLELPEHDAIVVHGGLVPGVPLEKQSPRDLIRMRSIRSDGSTSARIEDGSPWARVWPGPKHVYFGHDAVRGLQLYAHATGLDTGCVYGGKLTAMILPERQIVSVDAERRWSEPEGEP